MKEPSEPTVTQSQKEDKPEQKNSKEKTIISHAIDEGFAAEELIEELRDKDQMGKRGEVVFLMQIVTILLIVFPPMKLQGVIYFAGILSFIFGGIITCVGAINLGRSFSPLITPRKNNTLVTSGLYQYMRHPIYSGLIMLGFGLSALCFDESRLLLTCLLTFIVNYKASKEEEALINEHGDAYRQYMSKVGRFAPTL